LVVKILLDTNAYSALMRGQADVADRVRRAEGVIVSTVVAGELLFGFRAGKRFEENQRRFRKFLDNPYVSILAVSLVTADRFGRVAANLRANGRPIPSNDIWIAAHALESGAELLSSDEHFEAVDGLVWTRILAGA
jgi:tRNA(fMet)-specific endonuclease VapC